MQKDSNFTHPLHARGIRSGGIPVLRGPLLSDARILHYIRKGFYGEEARRKLAEQEDQRLSKKKQPKVDPLAPVLRLLGL